MLKAVQLNRQVVLVLSLAMIVIGVYATNTKVADVVVAMQAGCLGYAMLRYGYSTAVAALGVFLGGEFERSLRIGLNMNNNSFADFFSRPTTLAIFVCALVLLAIGLRKQAQTRRRVREARADETHIN